MSQQDKKDGLYKLVHKDGPGVDNRVVIIRPGDHIVSRGAAMDRFLTVFEGDIRITEAPNPALNGKVIRTGEKLNRFQVVGAYSFFKRQPSQHTMIAESLVVAYVVGSQVLAAKSEQVRLEENPRALLPTALALLRWSDMASTMKREILQQYGAVIHARMANADIDQLFKDLNMSLFDGLRDDRANRAVVKAVQNLLRQRNEMADDPSMVIMPDEGHYVSYKVENNT